VELVQLVKCFVSESFVNLNIFSFTSVELARGSPWELSLRVAHLLKANLLTPLKFLSEKEQTPYDI